ncbi:MAG: alanine--tRNA ligase [Chloroflexi bacterium]|nr:alanine--tRNA ligase [Chloroflexota bacterium]
MAPLTSDQIRAAFLEFWKERGSQVIPSSSLIPHNDPTVLLTTAGMQQFVPYFLGQQAPPSPRMTSVQKCFRTVDIDEVGDPRHLTFFEMMGNFSVGEYFKAEVIPWAYELVTQKLAFPAERLWITVHETDDEAEAIWLLVGVPPGRIVRLGDEHNWWGPPGKTGPCGPDSEIYFQQDPGHGCGFPEDPPDCDCGRLEFWNLVFMQYFQDERGVRTPLPRKNVDTGIGLERTTALAQGTPSVYETDLFLPIMQAAAEIAGTRYGADPTTDFALRVLGDHGRGLTFLVADGVVPGTGGREYVLRRIMRRAIRYGRMLGITRPFLGGLVDTVGERMGEHYPVLRTDRARIRQIVDQEEELFTRTLRAGLTQIERLVAETRARGTSQVAGERVFDLYQTHGFPPELTEEVLHEQGLHFAWDEYRVALDQERRRAQAASAFAEAEPGGTNEFPEAAQTGFLAWTDTSARARVLGLRAEDERAVSQEHLQPGAPARLVLEASPFYPEGGGQVGDRGRIVTPSGVFEVQDTQFDGAGHVVHIGRVVEGAVQRGELAAAEVDLDRRARTMRHHTVTHLLHRALKDVLGEGTSQQGSLVAPDMARFDFNYPRALSREQLQAVASIINDRAMQDLPVHWEVMGIDAARKTGATMMFGEKYGEQVRVVSIGDYSKELCGGTHTHHAGELGLAVIAAESGIGSGKRRIVALAGQPALRFFQDRVGLLERVAERAGAPSVDEAPMRVDALVEELERARTELQRLKHQQAHESAATLAAGARQVGPVRVVAARVEQADDAGLKQLVDAVREDLGSGVVVLASVLGDKPRFVVGITRDLLVDGRLNAGAVLRDVARAAGGGGGGRPDFATGGGGDAARIPAALEQAFATISAAVGA